MAEKNKYPATSQSIIKIMLLIKFQEFFKKMFSCSGAFRLKVYIFKEITLYNSLITEVNRA